jgi:hypothetical protein
MRRRRWQDYIDIPPPPVQRDSWSENYLPPEKIDPFVASWQDRWPLGEGPGELVYQYYPGESKPRIVRKRVRR